MRASEIISGYTVKEITNKNTWNSALTNFNDANIYQTWKYALITQNEKSIKHLAVYHNEDIIGMSQVRYSINPLTKHGIAYIFSGPLWQRKDREVDFNILASVFQS